MRKTIIFGVVLCFLFVSIVVPLCSASGVDAANAGLKAYKKGDKKKASVLFKSALKSNELSKENYIIVNNYLCELFRAELKNDEAIGCYSETLYLNPDNPVALLGRGTLYNYMGQYENAIEDLSRYTDLAPSDFRGYICRGLAWRELKKYDKAISDMSYAVRLRPGNGEAYVHRGVTYFKAGNYNIALADFKKAVKIDPENPYTYQAMAWLYAACPNGDYRDGVKAVELAKKAVKLETADPADPVFQATLAAAYAESGVYGKAVDIEKKAIVQAKGNRVGSDLTEKERQRSLQLYERGEPYRGE